MADTSTQSKPYQLVGAPIHQNQWDPAVQAVVSGWTVRARWLSTGAIIPVFVPDTDDLVSTADTLIRFTGAQLDALAAKGA